MPAAPASASGSATTFPPCRSSPAAAQHRAAEARNSIINSFNRNFPRRNDGNPDTLSFIASPEIVIAYGLAGRLSFNPLTDTLEAPDGSTWMLEPPAAAPDLPAEGFVTDTTGFVAARRRWRRHRDQGGPEQQAAATARPLPGVGRPGLPRTLPVLLKAQGKCTTDHISPAGPWLRFRGHLDNISDNMFIGAINAYTGEAGTTRNDLTGEENVPVAQVARDYKAAGMPWVVVGDENYGEGSSREHAAMEPRFLGAAAIVVKSLRAHP